LRQEHPAQYRGRVVQTHQRNLHGQWTSRRWRAPSRQGRLRVSGKHVVSLYTVIENFRIALKFQGIAQAEWDDRAMRALKAVGMASFARHYPEQLSVGMRQRVNMARGICVETEILLMDEPFAALDEQTRMVLGEDLSQLLAATGKTIVFVTHSLAEAVFLSDRIVVMTARPGRIKTIIEVNEPHPRSPDFMLEPRFSELRNECYALLRDEIRATMAAQRDPQPQIAGA
jgi:NitT/TauT family transport system ATP-binding protein